MSTIVEVVVHPDAWLAPERLRAEACKQAHVPRASVASHRVLRKAVDARRGHVRLRVRVELLAADEVSSLAVPVFDLPALHGEPEVAIVGAGPGGLFTAWALARLGVRARVIERGRSVRPRRRDLARLTRKGELDPDSNYCFGEGGAGTFSDGKLYTRSTKRGPVRDVLEVLVAHGADPDIFVDARPHIGTNRLPSVVTHLREHLIAAGVELLFETRVVGLSYAPGRVHGVVLQDGRVLPARAVVLAPGHSAADVLRFVHEAGARVEFKPFAMGVRIEHAQAFIDRLQYGALAGHPALGAASYRVVEAAGDTSVFSFCMCPGGFIAPAATEAGAQVVNGWSPSSRRGRFANSGFVVEVGSAYLQALGLSPEDPFAGLEAQRALEREAYRAGGGAFVAPAQRLADFVHRRTSRDLPVCSYPRGLEPAPLDRVLGPLAEPIRAALVRMDARMPGFAGPEAVAVGVESRTSCPVRIVRDPETLASPTLAGLYPCGEGAGHAGGIMSAALDGMRVAECVAAALR